MRPLPTQAAPRGMTLLELMFVVAIMGVVIAGLTRSVIDVFRTQAVRTVTNQLQGQGRDGLRRLEHELRAASLGAPFGVVWTQDAAGAVVKRPAVQLYDNVSAKNPTVDIGIKAGTDAVLIVGGVGLGVEGATRGTSFDSTAALTVTDATPFAVGQTVLLGPFKAAAWGTIRAVNTGLNTITLGSTQNVYPDGKLDTGSWIHQSKATLFYVDTNDQLVEQEVLVPRAPATMAELGTRRVLAQGVENLQFDCELDSGVAFAACPAATPAGPMADEAKAAFGVWGAIGGPRLTEVSIGTLRTVNILAQVRSQRPLANQHGDSPISIGNVVVIPVGGGDDTLEYVRRAYSLPVAVRNVSLGAL
jgi:prepilin-type N-terminal cleavage/methylation domain-containing protein